jgi:transmembrane sensor
VEEIAAGWLERRETGTWSDEDQRDLDGWLSQAYVHKVAYLRLKSTWDRADRLVVLRPQTGSISPTQRKMPPVALQVAAAILLLIAGTTAIRESAPSSIYATGLGEHKNITLADGTRIELNTNTILREKYTDKSRIITLDRGEAYFAVHHDEARPFVVKVGEHSVTDIGTKFFVRRDTDRLSVGVTEGQVELGTAKGHRGSRVLLDAGKFALITSAKITIFTKAPDVLANDLAWRAGMLVFNHTTLAEAAAEFNRYNREKLVIADSRAAGLSIGGTFRQSDVRQFARVARALLGVHIKDKPAEQIISLRAGN